MVAALLMQMQHRNPLAWVARWWRARPLREQLAGLQQDRADVAALYRRHKATATLDPEADIRRRALEAAAIDAAELGEIDQRIGQLQQQLAALRGPAP